MNFLIIGDPIKSLKPHTDTSLAFAREALSRHHEVCWASMEEVFFWEGRVYARYEKILACKDKSLPATEPVKEPEVLNSFDGVWLRKDPPFDQNYLALCWLLAMEENNVPIVNKPSLLLRYHEKMLPWEAIEAGFLREEEVIPTFLSMGRKMPVPENFPRGEAVLKPFTGFGGKDVQKLEGPRSPEPLQMLQPLQKEIHDRGDRRIFILDGEVIGSFVRLPPEGEIKSNIAAGGRGIMKEMSKKEAELADRVAAFLKEIGIVFAGVDMIGDKISEINITSPTGFETYHSIGGPRLAPLYLNYVETLV